ncbi:hypothetical protein [Stutzerimonas nitrititolerans]|uniref:hypothetical protein n=1 Tax=Stutzerimonas nitrititolerans TaxID=2482751 RepID=UPI0028A76D0D|nr:hypothetical protein [Stutzerimonas nitrititolerans]
MKWKKLGLVFSPDVFDWSVDSALQPTPLVLSDRVRVFLGSRDASGVSRVGYVDLDKSDITTVMGWSKKPVFDIGEDGCFDESGVVPSAVVSLDDQVYMFYAGYQLGSKVRFSVLGGVAISKDGGSSFERVKRTPVFERNDLETLFRVPHSVRFESGIWKAWYGGGSHFVSGKTKSLPVYDIRYVESVDPYNFPNAGSVLLCTQGDEYRLGRPYLYKKDEHEFYLFYGYSSENAPYQLGCAFSTDMQAWKRIDSDIGLGLSDQGWDSEMMAYPSVIELNGKIYIFYNGNEYGKFGFGAAELLEW